MDSGTNCKPYYGVLFGVSMFPTEYSLRGRDSCHDGKSTYLLCSRFSLWYAVIPFYVAFQATQQ